MAGRRRGRSRATRVAKCGMTRHRSCELGDPRWRRMPRRRRDSPTAHQHGTNRGSADHARTVHARHGRGDTGQTSTTERAWRPCLVTAESPRNTPGEPSDAEVSCTENGRQTGHHSGTAKSDVPQVLGSATRARPRARSHRHRSSCDVARTARPEDEGDTQTPAGSAPLGKQHLTEDVTNLRPTRSRVTRGSADANVEPRELRRNPRAGRHHACAR